MVQASYICADCHFCVHHKCVENVVRICAHVVTSERKEPFEDICPENGLSFQSYKCVECQTSLSFSKFIWNVLNKSFIGKHSSQLLTQLGVRFVSNSWHSILFIPPFIDFPGWFYCLGWNRKTGSKFVNVISVVIIGLQHKFSAYCRTIFLDWTLVVVCFLLM